MANEICVLNVGASRDGYFQIWKDDLTVYNGAAFESYNASDWATQYAQGQTATIAAGHYKGNFPALGAGYYRVNIFACANGGTPASTDELIGTDQFYWDGSQRIDRLAGVAVASIAANAITADAIAANAIDADALKADVATEIAAGISAGGGPSLS